MNMQNCTEKKSFVIFDACLETQQVYSVLVTIELKTKPPIRVIPVLN